jgi:hypothetical protein
MNFVTKVNIVFKIYANKEDLQCLFLPISGKKDGISYCIRVLLTFWKPFQLNGIRVGANL